MGTRYLEIIYQSALPPGELRDMTVAAFRPLGGQVINTNNGFNFLNGKTGITFQSWADISATIVFQKLKETHIVCKVYMNWKWSALMWWIIVLGILTGGIPLLLLIPYLFFDPTNEYNQALMRAQNNLHVVQNGNLF